MNANDLPKSAIVRAELMAKVHAFPSLSSLSVSEKKQISFRPAQRPGLSASDALSDSQESAIARIKEDLLKLDKAIIARQQFAGTQGLPVDFSGLDRMRMEMGLMIKGLEDAYAKSWHARAAGFVKTRAA